MRKKDLSLIMVIGACVLMVVVPACHLGNAKLIFAEEVQLASGEIIKASRDVEGKPLGEIGGPGGWEPTYASFVIADPKRSSNPPKWESATGLVPILFDRDPASGEWVLLATFYMCEPWYALGRPKLPYAEFHVFDGQWSRAELSGQWLGRDANVFTGMKSSGEPKLLTLTEKKQRDSDPAISRRFIKIIDRWTTSC
jgi:hypothetical protein